MSVQLFRYDLNALLSSDGRHRPDDATIRQRSSIKTTPLQACLAVVISRTVDTGGIRPIRRFCRKSGALLNINANTF